MRDLAIGDFKLMENSRVKQKILRTKNSSETKEELGEGNCKLIDESEGKRTLLS